MAATDIDQKDAVDRLSDDNIEPTSHDPGHGASSSKLVPPPSVAAMSAEQRIEFEDNLRRKIDIRLLPMIILMYIMNYLGKNRVVKSLVAYLLTSLSCR